MYVLYTDAEEEGVVKEGTEGTGQEEEVEEEEASQPANRGGIHGHGNLHACAYIKRTAISLSTRTSPAFEDPLKSTFFSL